MVERKRTNQQAEEGMLRLGLSTTAASIPHARTALKANDGNKHRGITSILAKSQRMKHVTQGIVGGERRGGGRKGGHHRASVNASVNMPCDVFREAWISRRLLILVTADTCTLDALNVGLREERRVKDR